MAVYELLHLRHIWALFAFVAAISIWGRDEGTAALRGGSAGAVLSNVAARVGALVSSGRGDGARGPWTGGPAAVGIYTLAAGAAQPRRRDHVLRAARARSRTSWRAGPTSTAGSRWTLVAISLAGGALGTALWAACSPLLARFLFPDLSTPARCC